MVNWLLTQALNLLLDLAFGKQDQIERRTQPRSCHCWDSHTYMQGVQHSATCPIVGQAHAAVGRPPEGDYEYVLWVTEDHR